MQPGQSAAKVVSSSVADPDPPPGRRGCQPHGYEPRIRLRRRSYKLSHGAIAEVASPTAASHGSAPASFVQAAPWGV